MLDDLEFCDFQIIFLDFGFRKWSEYVGSRDFMQSALLTESIPTKYKYNKPNQQTWNTYEQRFAINMQYIMGDIYGD